MDGRGIQEGLPLHHQVIRGRPIGEGNTVFLSLSPEWDGTRAPAGKRALTISTHTELDSWWSLYQDDRTAYHALEARITDSLLSTAEKVIPGLREAAELILPGTPLTFQRFTSREMGWVGGFQQTSLLQNLGPRLGRDLWLVGDSIFPGQSVAAAALGGMRVAGTILGEHKIPLIEWDAQLKEAR
jgi:phytoene dehydrogenase-like protein